MSSEHLHGKALDIVQFKDDDLEFDKDELNALLLHPEVKERKIVVVTIVGAFRKGKSFFLDYCLRFMYANVSKRRFEISFEKIKLKLRRLRNLREASRNAQTLPSE